jgi:hypothetical protein
MTQTCVYNKEKRIAQIKWNDKNVDKVKEYSRLSYERLKNDPGRLEQKRRVSRELYYRKKDEKKIKEIEDYNNLHNAEIVKKMEEMKLENKNLTNKLINLEKIIY